MRSVLAAVPAKLLQLQLLFEHFIPGSGVVLLLTLATFEMNFNSCCLFRHLSLELTSGLEPPTGRLQGDCSAN